MWNEKCAKLMRN